MRQVFCGALVAASAILGIPARALGQNPALVDSFRPYFFVLLAFAAGWLLIGAWVLRIGKKMDRLSRRIEENSG
jgi:CcmD family protein